MTIDNGVITHTDTEVFYSIVDFTVYWVREIMVLNLKMLIKNLRNAYKWTQFELVTFDFLTIWSTRIECYI